MTKDYFDLHQFLLKTNLDLFSIKNKESIQLKVHRSAYNYDRFLGTQYENALKRIIELKFEIQLMTIKSLRNSERFLNKRTGTKAKFIISRDIQINKIKDSYLDVDLQKKGGILKFAQKDYKNVNYILEEFKDIENKPRLKLKDEEFDLNCFLLNYDPISEYKSIFKSDVEKNAFKIEIDDLIRETKFEFFKPKKTIYSNIQLNNSAHSIDFVIDNKLIDTKTSVLIKNIKLDYKVQLILYFIFYLREHKNLKEEKIHFPKIEYFVIYYARYSYWHEIKVEELFCIDSLCKIVNNIKLFSATNIEKVVRNALKKGCYI